ncbi:MAG: CPBP family glutamic-type intramembrane protease [Gammaproteobacteria bacterium]|nr:CPBP family glutamic-type intramembrane protease [Gammaproteobacteria bacterium]
MTTSSLEPRCGSGLPAWLAAFVGLWAARKLGLGVPLLEAWRYGGPIERRVGPMALIACALGIASAIFIIALDFFLFVPLDREGVGHLATNHPPAWMGLLASVYGGISEEILLRLFLLSVLALGMRYLFDSLGGRRDSPLPSAIFWTANLFVAILFGLGHLPATAELITLTSVIVARAIVLNGVVGLIAGFLFWRRGLEMAMVCHFSADIVLHVLYPLTAGP